MMMMMMMMDELLSCHKVGISCIDISEQNRYAVSLSLH